jgi:hypothetical protein
VQRASQRAESEREKERESESDPERAEWSLLLTVVAKDFDQPK